MVWIFFQILVFFGGLRIAFMLDCLQANPNVRYTGKQIVQNKQCGKLKTCKIIGPGSAGN